METEGKTIELMKQRDELKETMKHMEDGPELTHKDAELMEVEFKINTIRRRTFGNVQFIGELFNCGLLRVPAVIKASFDHLITSPENADDEKQEENTEKSTGIYFGIANREEKDNEKVS